MPRLCLVMVVVVEVAGMAVKVIPSGLEMELRALYMPRKHSTSELHFQPHRVSFKS